MSRAFFTYWSLRNVSGEAPLEKAFVPPEYIPDLPSPVSAAHDAVKLVRKALEDNHHLEPLPKIKGHVRWAYGTWTKPGDSATFTQLGVWGRRADGEPLVDGTYPRILDEVYREQSTRLDTQDWLPNITKMVRRWCGGVSMRETGGIYLVPQSNLKRLEAVQQLVEALSRDSTMDVIPVDASTPRALRSLSRAVDEDVSKQLADLSREIRTLQQDRSKTRAKEDLDALRWLLDCHVKALGTRLDAAERAWETAKNDLDGVMSGENDEQEEE